MHMGSIRWDIRSVEWDIVERNIVSFRLDVGRASGYGKY